MKSFFLPALASILLSLCVHAMPVRLNHLQVIGTHNSYHVRPPDELLEAALALRSEAQAWDYTHDPLDVQLDNGVRNFELDLHPFKDGLKVFHVPIVDAESTCPEFLDCLLVVRAWSDRHPDHIPISFLFEFKEEEALLAGKALHASDDTLLRRVEDKLLAAFPREKIILPDDVRGDFATLAEAVRAEGWPLLEETLGKVFFVLHNRGELRDAYTENHPSLEGRLMFVNSSPERADGAFSVIDNPYSERIDAYAALGMITRVRSDSGLREGRSGDTGRRDAAFASGAHIISTDFPRGRAHRDTGYVVAFPGDAPARCNPLNAPENCGSFLDALFEAKGHRPPRD